LKGLTFVTADDHRINQLVQQAKDIEKRDIFIDNAIKGSLMRTPEGKREVLAQAVILVQQGVFPNIASAIGKENLKFFKGVVVNGQPLSDPSKFFTALSGEKRAIRLADRKGFFGTNTGLGGGARLPHIAAQLFNARFEGGIEVGTGSRQLGKPGVFGGGFDFATSIFLQDPDRLQQKLPRTLRQLTANPAKLLAFIMTSGGITQQTAGNMFIRLNQNPIDIIEQLNKGGFASGFRTAQQKLGLMTAAKQVAITDDNVNRLRNGGTLKTGMTVFQEGAVIGGFRHVSDYRDWLRRKRNALITSSERSLQGFGIRTGGGSGSIDFILRAMARINSALVRAGLTVPGRGGTVKGNLAILATARRKIRIGEGLLGLDPRFDEDMIKTFTEMELQERLAEQNLIIKNFNDALELDRQQIIKIRFDLARGDRELENRQRFAEAREETSSGTSPI